MSWSIEIDRKAIKELNKLDKQIQTRIIEELFRIKNLADPRTYGKALAGTLSGLWRYRIGDYRIICRIIDSTITITVIRIAHRKEIYD